jgi:hypothetical protein
VFTPVKPAHVTGKFADLEPPIGLFGRRNPFTKRAQGDQLKLADAPNRTGHLGY